jgi:cell wall-associated NlpC family hydrolase
VSCDGTPDNVIRAKRTLGHGCFYKLGTGGFKAARVLPWPDGNKPKCDCTGLVNWANEDDRLDYNTDKIVREATANRKLEEGPVRPIHPPGRYIKVVTGDVRPGDVVVYPSKFPKGKKRIPGHAGIMVTVVKYPDSGNTVDFDKSTVIHCSSGNSRKYGDAIRITPAGLFDTAKTIFARRLPRG